MANAIAVAVINPFQAALAEPFLLAPPKGDGPVVVRARFDLHNINEINDEMETFEFTGVLTLKWNDPRMAFDPAVEGVNEKVFQGDISLMSSRPGGIRKWSSSTNLGCTRMTESCCVFSPTELQR